MTAKPKRRWYQFSLKTLLILTTIACLVAAMVALFVRSRHFRELGEFHRSQLLPNDNIRSISLHLHMQSSLKAKNPRVRTAAEHYFATLRFHQQAADAFDQAARRPWQEPSIPIAPELMPVVPSPNQTIGPPEIPSSWIDLEVISDSP